MLCVYTENILKHYSIGGLVLHERQPFPAALTLSKHVQCTTTDGINKDCRLWWGNNFVSETREPQKSKFPASRASLCTFFVEFVLFSCHSSWITFFEILLDSLQNASRVHSCRNTVSVINLGIPHIQPRLQTLYLIIAVTLFIYWLLRLESSRWDLPTYVQLC